MSPKLVAADRRINARIAPLLDSLASELESEIERSRPGAESVLNFIRKQRNPTTREINQNWKAEGRGGTADNTLTLLTKNRQLKRSALEGERGSRYQVA